MASIHKTFTIDAPAASVWDALADVGAIPTRLVPELVVDTTLEGEIRTVTFSNGFVVRERLIDIDHARRRIAYSASGGQLEYHHASMQVVEDGDGRCRFEWVTDLKPDEARDAIVQLIDEGSRIMQKHLARHE